MLRFLPEWWINLMQWLDSITIPLWVVLLLCTILLMRCVWAIYTFWRDLRDVQYDPPPPFL